MRNFGGLPVLVALGLLLSACSSEPNLIAGDAADATQPSVQSTSAIADDSAPFEVVPNAGAFLETTDEFSADDYPLLRYMEPNGFDSRHPGRAQLVLIDDGEPAREGSDQFPLFVIGISAYIAESAPIDYYFFYNNHNQNEFGEIGYGRCRGVSGRFAQQSSTTYRFEEGRYPQVEDHGFDVTSQECGDMPPLTPANIFDGTVELEYGDTGITVISEDGERWVFQQIPFRSARQRAIDALPSTTAAATTTTTEVERTGSGELSLQATTDAPETTTTSAPGERGHVPLIGPAEAADRTSTWFGVGVSTCNGAPTAEVVESSDEIVVTATSQLPDPNRRDLCLDSVRINLEQPIGDRVIIDGHTQLPIGLFTDEDLFAPKPLD